MKTRLNLLASLLIVVLGLTFLGCKTDEEPTVQNEEELDVKIDVSEVNFTTDTEAIDGRRIKANQEVTFDVSGSGDPDSWEWTFEGGPESSTEKNPTVSWGDMVGQVMVILRATRSSDEATDSDTLVIQVGPVEMLNRVVFGFEENEDSDVNPMEKWFTWSPNPDLVSISMETSEGANSTSSSLKMNATSGYGEFQLRPHENGPEFLVSLESETSYIFSFYLKGSEPFTLSEASFLNVKNDSPVEGWYTPFWSGDEAYNDITVSTEWTKYSYEFTTGDLTTFGDEGYSDGTADNAGPFFKHFASFSGNELSIWIDEISLKEQETE